VLRSALARSSVVHVASHGLLEPRSPMFSWIRLASSATPAQADDDGRLETHEVLSLTVRSQLVYLSGCETALGPSWGASFEQAEDYATLAQAFLFAGAQNVIATLWRIEDRSAAEFAGQFYHALGSAKPAEALAMAQRGFIRSGRYRRPYYWAGYVLSGSGAMTPRPRVATTALR
jgi:CHAT domain-containing protein